MDGATTRRPLFEARAKSTNSMRLITIILWTSADESFGKSLKTLSSDHQKQRSLPLRVGEVQTKILMVPSGQASQTTMTPVSKVIAATLETDIQETIRDQSEMGRDLVTQDQGLLQIGEA